MAGLRCFILTLLAGVVAPCLAAAEPLTDSQVHDLWERWATSEADSMEGWRTLQDETVGPRLMQVVQGSSGSEVRWKARLLVAICHKFECGGIVPDPRQIGVLVPDTYPAELISPEKDQTVRLLEEEYLYVRHGVLNAGRVVIDPWEALVAPPESLLRFATPGLVGDHWGKAPGFAPLFVACAHATLCDPATMEAQFEGVSGVDVVARLLEQLGSRRGIARSIVAYWKSHPSRAVRDVFGAEQHLHCAAGDNYPQAVYYLGLLFDPHDGPSPDLERARRYYKAALERRQWRARERLQLLAARDLPGRTIADLAQEYEQGWQGCEVQTSRLGKRRPVGLPNWFVLRNPGLAAFLRPHLDSRDGAVARCMLGECYLHGLGGVPRDLELARYWLENSGAGAAAGLLADAVFQRQGDWQHKGVMANPRNDDEHPEVVRRRAMASLLLGADFGECGLDEEAALRITTDSAKAGSACARWTLVEFFNARQQRPEAMGWLEKLADSEDPKALVLLGLACETGAGCNKDVPKAKDLLTRARCFTLTEAEAAAALQRIEMAESGAALESEVVSLEAHMNKHADAATWPGLQTGVAARWWRLRSHDSGALLCGLCLLVGHECEPDADTAYQYLMKAEEWPVANYFIGRHHEQGGLGRDAAMQVYRAAAQVGSACSAYRLGQLEKAAAGGKQDVENAARWFTMAGDGGCIPAMKALAALYEAGDGLDKNLAEAVLWYRKAAELGDEAAKAKLKELDK